MSEITWVCCPHGVADGHLRLSVVVVPALQPDGTLGDFPALRDWPARLVDVRWVVAVGAREVAAALAGEAPDVALWRSVFPASTPVRSFGTGADRARLPVVTYPAVEVADAVRDAYTAAAAQDGTTQPIMETFDLGPLDAFRAALAVRGPVEPVVDGPIARAYAMQHPPAAPAPAVLLDPDFHQIVTLLGEHPLLLRRLGLVVELAAPADGLEEAVAPVRLAAASTLPDGLEHRLPATAAQVRGAGGVFAAAGRAAAFGQGVWPVDRPEFRLESLDVDGAVRRGVALASSPEAAIAAPPALRNDGIALVHSGHGAALQARISAAQAGRSSVRAPAAPTLSAEDLVRGYRVDVADDATGAFHSLHARRVRYDVEGFGTVPAAGEAFSDEGFFQESVTGDGELFIHEHVVTWRGWSLSVPRPEAARRGGARPAGEAGALAALRIRVSMQVEPRSLPKLRFGRRYRFRLRTADLAGNSVALDAAPGVATSELRYLRYEPVPPPVFAPAAAATFEPGETPHRLVVREPPPTDDGFILLEEPPPSERLLLPPRGSVALAEQHGKLDDAIGNADRLRRGPTRELLARADAELSLPVGDIVPYLPDPQAAGIAFAGLPGLPEGEVFTVAYQAESWDAVHPIRLRLVAGDAPPRFDAASRTVTVALPGGMTSRVRVSSTPAEPALMALLDDTGRRLGAGRAPGESHAGEGRHPMLTPAAEIELVHAIATGRRTDFESEIEVVRGAGEAAAGLRTSLAVDPYATDAVAVQARWIEHVDDGSGGLPEEVTRSEQVVSLRLPPDAPAALPAVPGDFLDRHLLALDTERQGLPRQQFPDTGHRAVTYTPVSTSRFADCYPARSLRAGSGASRQVRVLNTAVPPPAVVHSVVPSQMVEAQRVESSGDIFELVTDPAAPDVLPAEPGFRRTTQPRHGGGIRVYLERPWFVTGADESLGVILGSPDVLRQAFPGAPKNSWNFDPGNPVAQWLSQAGQDPIREGRGVSALTKDDFLNSTQGGTVSALADGVGPDGAPLAATIVGYVPRFEEPSGRWYADVQVRADVAYMPFVRLAVARYQPNSLNEQVSLSRVSTIDIVQPLPSRTLTIIRHLDDPAITVTLRGRTYVPPGDQAPATVSARLFMAEAVHADLWRPVEDVAEFELVRDPDRELWSAQAPVPLPQPGRVVRLLVVERDQVGSRHGLPAKRIVYVGTIDL
jgi:hypothetical protein